MTTYIYMLLDFEVIGAGWGVKGTQCISVEPGWRVMITQ